MTASMKNKNRVFVAGHNGMVGSAIVRQLEQQGDCEVITRTRKELDLTNQQAVSDFFSTHNIQQVYLAAAKVGGIVAYQAGITNLLFLGSSCIYPKLAEQPMAEMALLTGTLEPTNEPYAVAKIAGIKLCESYNRQYDVDYRSVMPTNLYGPQDNFHPENSHVIPALLRRFHEAKLNGDNKVVAWGSGKPMREFLYVDDMAAACIHVMNLDKTTYDENTEPMLSHINVGTGVDCTIRELVETVAKVIGFTGEIEFDETKPDGAPRKLMNVERLESLGWKSSVSLEVGLNKSYKWFTSQKNEFRG